MELRNDKYFWSVNELPTSLGLDIFCYSSYKLFFSNAEDRIPEFLRRTLKPEIKDDSSSAKISTLVRLAILW